MVGGDGRVGVSDRRVGRPEIYTGCRLGCFNLSPRPAQHGLGLLEGPGLVSFPAVRLLDRYILAEWAKVFALAMLSFMGILLLSEAYNWIPDFHGWGASVGTILAFLLLGLVKNLSMLIPVSLLISVIFVLSTLNRNQEISAARAAGIGMWRLTAPLWAAGLFLAGLLALLNAVLVPDALEARNSLIEEAQFAALKSKGGATIPKGQASSVSFENAKARRLWLISNLGLATGGRLEGQLDAGLAGLGGGDLRAKLEGHALLGQAALEGLGGFLVHAGADAVEVFDDFVAPWAAGFDVENG